MPYGDFLAFDISYGHYFAKEIAYGSALLSRNYAVHLFGNCDFVCVGVKGKANWCGNVISLDWTYILNARFHCYSSYKTSKRNVCS
jgi:hypothetical protein